MKNESVYLNHLIAKNECGGLNIEGEADISAVFDKNDICIKSNPGDATLITSIKFHDKVNIVYLQINGVLPETNPSIIKCYVNKSEIDFSDVNDIPSTQQFDLTKEINKKIKVNIPKWKGVSELTFYFENEEADHLEIKGIEFYGSPGNQNVNTSQLNQNQFLSQVVDPELYTTMQEVIKRNKEKVRIDEKKEEEAGEEKQEEDKEKQKYGGLSKSMIQRRLNFKKLKI